MLKTDEILTELKGLDFSTYPFPQVQELIRSLGRTGFLVITLHSNMSITRARPGEKFSCKSDLSYLPQEKNIICKRASTPNKTMFYGSVIQEEQPAEENRLIAASECSTLLRGGIDTVGIEKITFGKWSVIQDINLVAIVDEKLYEDVSNNKFLSDLKEAYDNFIKLTPDIENKTRLISSFFAEEFSKTDIQNDYDYFLSAIFTEIITDDLGYDGVIYPSVQTGGQLGLNVAIKRETVENNLRLDLVAETTLYKKRDKAIDAIDKISELSTWEYYNSPQMNSDMILEMLDITDLNELTE